MSLIARIKRAAGLMLPELGAKPRRPRSDRRSQPRRATGQSGSLLWTDSNADPQLERVQIRDTSDGGIRVSLPEKVAVGQTVRLEPTSGPVVKAVVRYCRPESSDFSAGLVLVDKERRRVDRQPVQGEGTLDWVGELGKRQTAPASARDVTEFGLQLRVPSPVPVGEVARLSGEEMGCMGTVCYCAATDHGYLIGLHFSHQPYERESLDYQEEI